MDRAGLVGDDGPTHHGVFDIAYLRCLPNIVLMAPRDEAMLVHMLHTALRLRRRPVGAALPARRGRRRAAARDAACDRDRHRRDPARGPGASARRASRCSATAPASARRSRPRTLLERDGIAATVADARFAKPIDSGLVAQLAAEHELLVTIEEGVLAGGFGTAVWETLNDGGGAVAADPARRRCPTATSRTARRRCCTRRSASPPSGSPSASRAAIGARRRRDELLAERQRVARPAGHAPRPRGRPRAPASGGRSG